MNVVAFTTMKRMNRGAFQPEAARSGCADAVREAHPDQAAPGPLDGSTIGDGPACGTSDGEVLLLERRGERRLTCMWLRLLEMELTLADGLMPRLWSRLESFDEAPAEGNGECHHVRGIHL